jgi:hypothetical protein
VVDAILEAKPSFTEDVIAEFLPLIDSYSIQTVDLRIFPGLCPELIMGGPNQPRRGIGTTVDLAAMPSVGKRARMASAT